MCNVSQFFPTSGFIFPISQPKTHPSDTHQSQIRSLATPVLFALAKTNASYTPLEEAGTVEMQRSIKSRGHSHHKAGISSKAEILASGSHGGVKLLP